MIDNQSAEESSDKISDEKPSKLRGEETNETNCHIRGHLKIEKQLEDCPICFNRVDDRAYTDSCFHQFCRQCIEKWSHNHNKCPICRQTYSSILYNVRSDTEYERFPLSKPLNNSQTGMLLVDENIGLLFTPLVEGLYMINSRQTPHGIQQNILFLAPNQNFILQNMGTNVTFVRPEELDFVLSDLDEREALRPVGHQSHHNSQTIPVLREHQPAVDSHQYNSYNN